MLKLLRLGMVLHSKLSYLATLLSSGMLVCNLMMPLSDGSAWTGSKMTVKSDRHEESDGHYGEESCRILQNY